MDYTGFSSSDQDELFKLYAAVLFLGNISFRGQAARDGTTESQIIDGEAVERAAQLLGLSAAALGTCITTKRVVMAGQTVSMNLAPELAADARDALSKAIYSRAFKWIVDTINNSIGQGDAKCFIGALDIFGFENFRLNSFEQFCINYTNEKLQQHFNNYIFKLEQAEYEKEGISWTAIEFKDNQDCLDLIESKLGVLALLDEECRFPKASDATFLEKVQTNHAKHSCFESQKGRGTTFNIIHYAGSVSYETAGFLEKNRDSLRDDMLELLLTSQSDILPELFNDGKGAAREEKKRSMTLGGTFKESLSSLMALLTSTQPYYVRCIKPNSLKVPSNFDDELVGAQLRYAGMMETIKIRKSGYPVRYPFKEFAYRYRALGGKPPSFPSRNDILAFVQHLGGALTAPEGTWQVGKTKVFLRDYLYRDLEQARVAAISQQVAVLQDFARTLVSRRRYQAQIEASSLISACIRGWKERRAFSEKQRAVIQIQSHYRRHLAVRVYEWKKWELTIVQAYFRGLADRKRFLQVFS